MHRVANNLRCDRQHLDGATDRKEHHRTHKLLVHFIRRDAGWSGHAPELSIASTLFYGFAVHEACARLQGHVTTAVAQAIVLVL